jgi:hypothetical protein
MKDIARGYKSHLKNQTHEIYISMLLFAAMHSTEYNVPLSQYKMPLRKPQNATKPSHFPYPAVDGLLITSRATSNSNYGTDYIER